MSTEELVKVFIPKEPLVIDLNGKWKWIPKSEVKKHNRQYTVHPDWAASVLDTLNIHNRNMKSSAIHRMKEDLKDDNFYLIPNGIGFDKEGILLDGQTRLASSAETNKPLEVGVFFGLLREAQEVIDVGTARSASDQLIIENEAANKKEVSFRNMILKSETGFKNIANIMSRRQQINDLKKLGEACRWTFNAIKQAKGLSITAAVGGAVGRAYLFYQNDEAMISRLRDFVRFLIIGDGNLLKKDGVVDEDKWLNSSTDFAAIQFHHWIREHKGSASSYIEQEVFKRSEMAIACFLKGRGIPAKYIPSSRELFPLPEGIRKELRVTKGVDWDAVENQRRESQVITARYRTSMLPEEWKVHLKLKVIELVNRKGSITQSKVRVFLNISKRSIEVQKIYDSVIDQLLRERVIKMVGKTGRRLQLIDKKS